MMGYLMILVILAMGLLARSNLVVFAAVVLLILRFLHLHGILLWMTKRGVNTGLLILVVTILIPLATDQVTIDDLRKMITSPTGIIAIIGGLLATKLNGMGVDLLKIEPQLVIGMVVGSVVGIIFWGGIPVGPLMAGGLTALMIKIFGLL